MIWKRYFQIIYNTIDNLLLILNYQFMNVKKLLSVLAFSMTLTAGSMMAQQPYGGCWHPENIINWTPENDPDAKFNRSTVPLQPRFNDDNIKANATQFYDGQVSACLTMHPSCSQTPAQGANNFIGYNPTYWQYMDVLVWWAGSAGEGIIIPPSAPVTDAAHLNGVKVLGQIFFPPSAFGGQSKWVYEVLTEENGTFPYAKKLYEIAAYYGFDGWFINEETLCSYNDKWRRFFTYYFELADKDGNSHHEIQWYDMSTSFNGKKASFEDDSRFSYFSNYGSPSGAASNKSTFEGWGLGDSYFKQMYHGVECAQGGFTGNGSYFKYCFTQSGHNGSIDLFNPEEGIWKQVVKDQLDTEDACGDVAYGKMKTVFSNESRFWTNAAADPSNTNGWSGSQWPGLANAIAERSAITTKPFVSSFSAGLGKYRFVDGVKLGTQDWYHRGMQDILPTWRWWIENNSDGLKIDLDWDDAFNTGTSLKVTGTLTAQASHLTRLYKTKLAIANGDKFQLVYKGDIANTEVKLATADNASSFSTFSLANATKQDVNGWTVATIDISSLNGKTLAIIALDFKSNAGGAFNVSLGQLGILPGNYAPAAVSVSNLKSQNELGDEISDIRLIWDSPKTNSDIHHYNVYTYINNKLQLVGQTRNEGFYIPKFQRNQGDQKIDIYVRAVFKNMKESTAEAKLVMNYPALQTPDVTMSASTTLAKTGEEVTIKAKANRYPEGYEWVTPAGATLVRGQGTETAVFKFTNQGKYDITVKVRNASGTTTETIAGFIEVSNSKMLEKVSCGATIVAASGSLPPEDPSNLVDCDWVPSSVRAKWCIGGKKEHWVILGLQADYDIYRFRWADCGHKENYSDNVQCYRIEVSMDNANWTTVLDEQNRPENTKDDYIKPTKARYVRFTPYDEEKPITIRIWEFEVYSVVVSAEVTTPEDAELKIGNSLPQTTEYNLNGVAQGSDFKVEVTSSNTEVLDVTDVTAADGKINYTLNAKKGGVVSIVISLTNGGKTTTTSYTVTSVDPSIVNILLNKEPIIDENDFDSEDEHTSFDALTDGNKTSYWRTGYDIDNSSLHTALFDLGDYYEISSLKAFIERNNADDWVETTGMKVSLAAFEDEFTEIANVTTELTDNNAINLDKAIVARYVEFVFTAAAGKNAKIYELEVYGKEGELTVARRVPLTVTSGFNADVIAENTPCLQSTDMTLDDQGWVLYTSDVQEKGAVYSGDGKLTSLSGIPYQLGSPTEKNAAAMTKGQPKTVTLTFDGEHKAEKLHFLAISANGSSNVTAKVNYTDGTSSNSATASFQDWCQTYPSGHAVGQLGRILTKATSGYGTDEIENKYWVTLYEGSIAADPSKTIASLEITNNSFSSYPTVLAVSKEYQEVITGMENEKAENIALAIYPNPIHNGEDLNIVANANARIKLISLQGSVLKQTIATGNITKLPITGLSSGIYILMVEDDGNIQTAKLIVR